MTAFGQLQQLGRRQNALDAANLLQRAIFIVQALNRQQRAGDCFDRLRQVPMPKSRVEPDVVPTPKSRIDIVVEAASLLRRSVVW